MYTVKSQTRVDSHDDEVSFEGAVRGLRRHWWRHWAVRRNSNGARAACQTTIISDVQPASEYVGIVAGAPGRRTAGLQGRRWAWGQGVTRLSLEVLVQRLL